MSLGQNLRQLRKEKGWTQHDLGEKTGIKLAHISKLEKDDSDPKLSTITKLLEALGCTPNDLLFRMESSSTKSALRNYMEKALSLPPRDRLLLIQVIQKFLSADGLRLVNLMNVPEDALEDILALEENRELEDQKAWLKEMEKEGFDREADKAEISLLKHGPG